MASDIIWLVVALLVIASVITVPSLLLYKSLYTSFGRIIGDHNLGPLGKSRAVFPHVNPDINHPSAGSLLLYQVACAASRNWAMNI